jgi:hypothetical protein
MVVIEIFESFRQRVDARCRSELGVNDEAIERSCQRGEIGTIEVENIESDESNDEGRARDARDAPNARGKS